MLADGRPAAVVEEERGTVEEVMHLGSVLEPLDWRGADATSETARKMVVDVGRRPKEQRSQPRAVQSCPWCLGRL